MLYIILLEMKSYSHQHFIIIAPHLYLFLKLRYFKNQQLLWLNCFSSLIVAWPSHPCNCNFVLNRCFVVVNKEVWHPSCSSIFDWKCCWHGWPSGINGVQLSIHFYSLFRSEHSSPSNDFVSMIMLVNVALYTYACVGVGHSGDIYTAVLCPCGAWHSASGRGVDSLDTNDPSQSHLA